ncbi:MAG TPA: DNRLRE domain-containing protein [Polyangiaceae bacterium]|nr:DNRLRE domain-containing protein [Polyangiaceae bacterium]
MRNAHRRRFVPGGRRRPGAPFAALELGFALLALAFAGCGDAPRGGSGPAARSQQALTMTLRPGPEGKDALVHSLASQADVPHGNAPTFDVMAWAFSGAPGVLRNLIDFDLPALPASATLVKATLKLYANTTLTLDPGHSQLSAGNELVVQQVVSPWDEATVTWNTRPGVDAGDLLVLPPSASAFQNYEIDVTRFFQRELADPGRYHGLVLRLQTEQHYRSLRFASSDHPDPSLRPALVLEYTEGPAPLAGVAGRVLRFPSFGPLAGVKVDAGGGHVATTNAAGDYALQGLPLGTYTLRASLPGWTFGSPDFQDAEYTVTLSTGGQVRPAPPIVGYAAEPVVFVHGWKSGPGSFGAVPGEFRARGHLDVANELDTNFLGTPLLEGSARLVKSWIDEAKRRTGRERVILYGHSMGGLVARAYVEGSGYGSDVSHLFTFGSPHLGIPPILLPACIGDAVGGTGAVCQMTPSGMLLFNTMYVKRAGVDYHLVAGKAPMWTTKQVCFRLFGERRCILSIPWPDTEFRNAGGWALGALIPSADDAFIQTFSAAGMPGVNVDRYLTREVHGSVLGDRDYFVWDGGLSQEAFAGCARPVLLDHTRDTCGTRLWAGPPPDSFFRRPAPFASPEAAPLVLAGASPDGVTSPPRFEQLSRVDRGVLAPGERFERGVFVEGGPTSFAVSWQGAALGFKLVDPTGQVIDPAYVDSITDDSDEPAGPDAGPMPPEAVTYLAEAEGGTYYFPAARQGQWTLVLEAGADAPAGGVPFTAAASFDSHLAPEFASGGSFHAPGSKARLRLTLSESVASADASVAVRRPDGATDTVHLQSADGREYAADYLMPNASGYVELRWGVRGVDARGVDFERGGVELVQVESTALHLGTGHFDRATPRADLPSLNSELVVTLKVLSTYEGGELGAAASLVDAQGNVVAKAATSIAAASGENGVELRFLADDIYRSRADGPYAVRDVTLVDNRGAPLLAQKVDYAHTTQAYAYLSFAPAPGVPSVSLEGPYRVEAGEALSLDAIGIDPEGDPLVYDWDLDGDGSFETSGQAVSFVTTPDEPARVQPVVVRVTDPAGDSASAESSVEIIRPVVVNLAPQADAYASSTLAGSSVEHVRDGKKSAASGHGVSWVNGDIDGCTPDLPAWVELDFGELRTLKRVALYTAKAFPLRDYDVQVSFGGGWTTVAQVRDNASPSVESLLQGVVGTRLRVVGLQGPPKQPERVRITELEVYGY